MPRCIWSKDDKCQVLVYRKDHSPFPCDGKPRCLGRSDDLVDLRDLKRLNSKKGGGRRDQVKSPSE